MSIGRGCRTYVKAPMYAGRRRHRWKASEIHLESHNGPSEGSASSIFCRNQGRHAPNFMALGAVYLSVDALTTGVTSSGAAEESHTWRGFLFAWSTDARQEIRTQLPKTNSATSTGRIMPNPRCTRSNSSCWQKSVASSVRVDACGPVAVVALIMSKCHDRHKAAGNPSSEYVLSSGDAR